MADNTIPWAASDAKLFSRGLSLWLTVGDWTVTPLLSRGFLRNRETLMKPDGVRNGGRNVQLAFSFPRSV